MIKCRSFVVGILLTLLFFPSQCKLVDYEKESVNQKINFSVSFDFDVSRNPLHQIRHLFFDEIYKKTGIDTVAIQDVYINDIQFMVTGDNAASDTLDGTISFKIMTPVIPPDTLLKFQNIILPPSSNIVISLFSENTPLAVDYIALEKLKSLLIRTAPPVIVFFFDGAAQPSPVNIQVNIKFDVQIELKT